MDYNTHQNHPLIEREQTYFLDRKLISIHSEDRDINKWPSPSEFEIELPEYLVNVSSLRLINVSMPNNLFSFTNNYQNTKFRVTIQHDISESSIESVVLSNYSSENKSFEIEIEEGFYNPDELANEIQAKLNKTVTTTLIEYSSLLPNEYIYNKFRVKFNKIQHKIYIINTRDDFRLLFNEKITYSNTLCGQKEVWEQPINWGLPYNLGFNKEIYSTTFIQPDLPFFYDNLVYAPDIESKKQGIHYISSIDCVDIFGSNNIYLELDKYNSLDEIEPYSTKTNNLYNNDYAGKINSAFAKLPVFSFPFSHNFDSKNGFLNNITFFKTPIPRIRKFKFKLRHHDGRLVDFKRMPFSFTIECNQLIDQQHNTYSIHAPYIYKT